MPTGKPTKLKPCKICGELFIPEKPSTRICPKDHIRQCPICGQDMIWNTTRALEPCSKECRKEATKRKNIAKYGVEHPMQNKQVQANHRKAMLAKYGVESPLQSEEIRAKANATMREHLGTDWALGNPEIVKKSQATMIQRYGAPTTLQSDILRKQVENTCLARYGVPTVFQSEDVQKKINNTNFLKYGVAHIMQNEDIKAKVVQTRLDSHGGQFWTPEMQQKAKDTSMARYGVDNPSKSPEIQAKIKQVMIDRYGVDYGVMLSTANKHRISLVNKQFAALLADNGIECDFEFPLGGKLYDIVIPDQKILIEIDPTYTHNAVGNHWAPSGLDEDYHKKKSEIATEAGYHCIHVFDWDDWNDVIQLIKEPSITINADDCVVYKLKHQAAQEFLSANSTQPIYSEEIVELGIVKDDEILQVMTFGRPRYDKSHTAELLRLCTKSGCIVVGGAEKLFKFATDYMCIDDIISYCDLSKFSGDVYKRLGMTLARVTPPQKVWSKNSDKITDNLLRQRGFDQLFKTNYGKGTSNEALMLASGWLPVYDCGQAVYTYTKSL